MVSSKRARQIASGAREPLVPWENDKPTVVALREIEEGLVDATILNEKEPQEEFIDLDMLDNAVAMATTPVSEPPSDEA